MLKKYLLFTVLFFMIVGFIPQSCSPAPEPVIPVDTLEEGIWIGQVDSDAGFSVNLEFTVEEIDGAEISGTANFVDEPVPTDGTMTGVYTDPNWEVTLESGLGIRIELVGILEDNIYSGTTRVLNEDATFEFQKGAE